jgi:Zn-dependent protease
MTPEAVTESIEDIVTLVGRYFAVDGYYTRNREVMLRGTLPDETTDWRSTLASELKARGYGMAAHQEGTSVRISIYPARRKIPWLNIGLFVATAISVSILPAYFIEGSKVFHDFSVILRWQRFAIPLLLILLFHEFGHYLAARRRGIRVSLPYFLPAPSAIGTFGAFIKSNSPFPSRRDLLEVGAYGPIAGFVVALIFLFIALSSVVTHQVPPGPQAGALVEPIIMRIAQAIAAPGSMRDGYDIFLQDNPMLFAAWVGMVVTMLNLLPVGQLDGGHIIYALSPRWHRRVSRAVFLALVGFGLIWPGWWIWAILIFFVIRFGHPPTLNDYQPLERQSRWIGWAAIGIFILTFSPVPF